MPRPVDEHRIHPRRPVQLEVKRVRSSIPRYHWRFLRLRFHAWRFERSINRKLRPLIRELELAVQDELIFGKSPVLSDCTCGRPGQNERREPGHDYWHSFHADDCPLAR